MICVFFDETSDTKINNYFGLTCAAVNHNHYGQIKQNFQKILIDEGWECSVEFKGSILFSLSKGCTSISVDKRIKIAKKVIDLNIAKKNSRMKFAYLKNTTQNIKEDYLKYIPSLLDKILKNYKKLCGKGKDLISIHCDYRNDITVDEIRNKLIPVIKSNNYKLYEDIQLSKSNF